MGLPNPRRRRALLAAFAVPACIVALLVAGAGTATADTRIPPTTPATTAQLDGVGFAQVVIGRTVYVGGLFGSARPAGAARGRHTSRRANLLAYDLDTGALKAWAPKTNGPVRALAASPDGKTVYAVGAFTKVDGHKRNRIVAVAASTGGVRAAFHPSLNSGAYGVAVHGATVYVGGHFTTAAGRTRPHVAAFSRTTGALRAWAPKVNADVLAVVVSKTGRSAVLAGRFSNVNGSVERGTQRVNTTTGRRNLSWGLNSLVGNYGPDAAVYSLSSDGTSVFGTGYSYAAQIKTKRLEGSFVATWKGALHWIEDCHGDTYSIAASTSVVFIAGHPHGCDTVPGGFSETDPLTYHRALAFTRAATGTLKATTKKGYSNFSGRPAPTELHWYPAFNIGTVTGQSQGPWSVVVAGGYVVYAGEFTTVDGHKQQGLARFRL